MNRFVKVRGIVLLDGKLLCVRLKPYFDGAVVQEKPYWCLPGGGVDDGEPLLDAMKREMIEELGVEPKVGRLLYVHQFAHKETDFLEFFFNIENATDYLNIDLTKTTHGTIEIEEVVFIDPTTANLLPEFLQTEPLADFAASNQPAKLFASY